MHLQLASQYLLSDLHLKKKTNINLVNNIAFTIHYMGHYSRQYDYIIHIAELLTATFPNYGKEGLACACDLVVH